MASENDRERKSRHAVTEYSSGAALETGRSGDVEHSSLAFDIAIVGIGLQVLQSTRTGVHTVASTVDVKGLSAKTAGPKLVCSLK